MITKAEKDKLLGQAKEMVAQAGGPDFAQAKFNSLVVDSGGSPHIAYCFSDYVDGYLKYARRAGPDWQIVVVDITGAYFMHACLALDADARAHVGYFDHQHGNLKYAREDSAAWGCLPHDGPRPR